MTKLPYSPYNNTSWKFRKNLLFWSGIFTIILTLTLRLLDQSLVTPGEDVPNGMVAFELTNSIQDAHTMMDRWGEQGNIAAAFSLGIDYLYLISYSILFGLISYQIGKRLIGRSKLLSKSGYFLSWFMIVAALFDGIENFALIKILFGCQSPIWATTSYYFATMKFTIVLITLIYIILGSVIIWFTKPSEIQPA